MDSITAVPGAVTLVLIISSGSSLLLSIWLLWLYRRATLRGMTRAARAGVEVPAAPGDTRGSSRAGSSSRMPLRFRDIGGDASMNDTASARAVLEVIGRSQRQAAAVYVSAGLAYALTMTIVSIILAGDGPSTARVLMLMCVYLWPTVIASSMTSVVGARERLLLYGGYASLLLSVSIVIVQRDPELSIVGPMSLWAIANLPATVLFVLTLQDRVRSVGPMVLAFVLCGVSGAVLFGSTVLTNDSGLSVIVDAGQLFGMSATSLFVLVFLTGFALAAVAGRYLLQRLGDAYRRKRCSDRSIALDSMWLIFAVVQSIGFAFEGIAWTLAAPVAFIAQRLVVSLGFRIVASRDTRKEDPLELLLLRVFSLGRRSTRFFDTFSGSWRQVGHINMIAGPDLVTASVEPHEFLEFVGGDMSGGFVVDVDDLDRRMQVLDREPDPDARYRVHEFFCHDDTWRMTMQRLAADSHTILMDLRSFTESNQGCLYELDVLLATVDLRRIVFMVDATTDRAFLEQSFIRLWSRLDERSPNDDEPEPTVRLYEAGRQDRRAISTLIAALLQHAPDACLSGSSSRAPEPVRRRG